MSISGDTPLECIDLCKFIYGNPNLRCEAAAQLYHDLHTYSAIVFNDPRVSSISNNRFLDMMEEYFAQDSEALQADMHPDIHYQVGLAPAGLEPADPRVFRLLRERQIPSCDWPTPCSPDHRDPKFRFMHRIGERPRITDYPELNAPPVIPSAFKANWKSVMDRRGGELHKSVFTIAHMLGWHFKHNMRIIDDDHYFTKCLKYGPHLLSPNAIRLDNLPKGTVINAAHLDFNWGTVHGIGRFRAARLWPRQGRSFLSSLGQHLGHLRTGIHLFQVGEQLEHMTGGLLQAGLHEVAVFEQTLQDVAKAKREGRSTIRVSSTLFATMAHDRTLEVVPGIRKHLKQQGLSTPKKYPPIKVGEQVRQALSRINFRT